MFGASLRRLSRLGAFLLVLCISAVLGITIYFINFSLPPNIRFHLSPRELLFLEGLLFLVFGVFFLASRESRRLGGAKRWLLYGAPSMGTTGKSVSQHF